MVSLLPDVHIIRNILFKVNHKEKSTLMQAPPALSRCIPLLLKFLYPRAYILHLSLPHIHRPMYVCMCI
jgi:hypothetical protein